MLFDDDPKKWDYQPHTRAKHAVLHRYMKAWLAILGRGAHRSHRPAEVVIVDAFAGRGRFATGEPGSPLIFAEVAIQAIDDHNIDRVDLFLIEANPANHAALREEITKLDHSPLLRVHLLERGEFTAASRHVLADLTAQRRPSFWFIDPFGFAGLPLILIREILSHPRSEAFINFMARDINRFLEEPNHSVAVREMFGLTDVDYSDLVRTVLQGPTRIPLLRQQYESRLRADGNAKFLWSYRVAEDSAPDTVYYLVHASNHVKAFREMKDATHEESASGQFAYLGRDDFGARSQLPLFRDDQVSLQARLLEAYKGVTLTFDNLCDLAYPDPRFFHEVESDFRAALRAMISNDRVIKYAVDTKTPRGLSGNDRIEFPRGT